MAESSLSNLQDQVAVTVAVGKDKNGTSGHSFSKTGPPKLELQMGRKWHWRVVLGLCDLLLAWTCMVFVICAGLCAYRRTGAWDYCPFTADRCM